MKLGLIFASTVLAILTTACSGKTAPQTHVINNPQVQFVVWGGQDASTLESDWKLLFVGGVLNRLTEYGVSGGSVLPSINAHPELMAQTFDDLWIVGEMTDEIQAEPGVIYVVVLPPGSSTIKEMAFHETGYHEWLQVPFAIVTANEVVISHEIYEAATNPDGFGYHWGAQEIGDYCEQQTETVAGITVQKVWSAKAQACL